MTLAIKDPQPHPQPPKKLGQYFTINTALQEFVFSAVKHKSAELLEPSFGAGHLLQKFKEYDKNYPMVCYELDADIVPVVCFNKFQQCTYGDFTTQDIRKKFRTIIGNPPYVKQAAGNLYIIFIEMCYTYLANDGELIFIVPSNFIKATRAAPIITTMSANGRFTDFLFPHNDQLFAGAAIDVMVFRYEKGLPTNQTIMNGRCMVYNITGGIITFSGAATSGTMVADLFDVYVGLISGYNKIYKVPFGNIHVLTDAGQIERFIFTETFPSGIASIDEHLAAHKDKLLGRKIRKFNETNWHEWGAPRNIASIRRHWGRPCIYVRTMTRNAAVAFSGHVQYFSGGLLCLVAKTDIPANALQKIIAYFNTLLFKENYMYAGRFIIGQRQISNAMISC